jgi:hypothetical protein
MTRYGRLGVFQGSLKMFLAFSVGCVVLVTVFLTAIGAYLLNKLNRS